MPPPDLTAVFIFYFSIDDVGNGFLSSPFSSFYFKSFALKVVDMPSSWLHSFLFVLLHYCGSQYSIPSFPIKKVPILSLKHFISHLPIFHKYFPHHSFPPPLFSIQYICPTKPEKKSFTILFLFVLRVSQKRNCLFIYFNFVLFGDEWEKHHDTSHRPLPLPLPTPSSGEDF